MSVFLLYLIALICAVCTTIPFIHLNILFVILIFVGSFIAYVLLFIFAFFIIVWILTLPITRKKKYHYNNFYRKVLLAYERFVLKLFRVKLTYEGLENVPADTNFLVVCNHKSNCDSFMIDTTLGGKCPVIFVAKQSLFFIPFFGKLIHGIGYISLTRTNTKKDVSEIKRGIELMDKCECSIGVFPEGTRNFSQDTLLPFKDGTFHFATRPEKPIVICTLRGTSTIKKHLLTKKHYIHLKFIKTITPNEYKDLNTHEISDLVRNTMLEDLKK